MPISGVRGVSSSSNSSTTYISSGTTIAPTIVYNTGLGTVTIGDGTYRFFHSTNYTGAITEHIITGTTFSIVENITIYICSDYNNGTPILRTITDSSQFNWSNIIPIYTVTRDGDNFSYVNWDAPGNGLPNKIHDRLIRTDRFSRELGLSIGESALPLVRTIIVSSGVIWQGVYHNSMDSVDSSVDIVKMLYTDGTGSWIDSFITQYNNTQYDTGTGLATLTDGNYAVNWIFRLIGNTKEIVVFLGDGDFDLNTAKASQLPNNIPASMSTNGMLIGRIIVLKGADTAIQIDSAFVTKFAASTVTSHSGLTGIEGGDANLGNYYHSDQEINKGDGVEFNSVTSQDNLTLDALTGKNIVVKKSIVPDLNNTHSIGSSTKVIKEIFTEAVTSDVDLTLKSDVSNDIIFKNGDVNAGIITSAGNWGIGNINPTKKLEVAGDVFIDGALTVDGTVTQVNVENLDVTNKNINLAVTDAPTDALANGGGIVLKGTTDKTILWDNSNAEWDISDGLDVDGIIKANGTTSDGSTNIFVGKDSFDANVFKVDTDGVVSTPKISPLSDSTTGILITKADKNTVIVNIDTTNIRIGIGTNSPLDALDINPGTAETWQRIYGATNAGIKFVGDENSDWWVYKSGGGSYRIAQTPDGGTTLINRLELDTASYSALRSPDGIGFIAIYNAESVSKNMIRPSTNNTYDLGTNTYKWKDSYFSGSVITPKISPSADGSSGILITKADKTTGIMTINTTLGHVGIGTAANTVSTLFVNNPDHTRAALFETDQSVGASSGATGAAHFTCKNGTGDFNNYGIRIATTTQGGGNAYGIYVDADTGVATGSKYGIYVAGTGMLNYFAGKIGVGTATPNASAILDLSSTSQGFICPRMTKAQRLAITPVEGLEVFQTDSGSGKYIYSNGAWEQMSGLSYMSGYKTVNSAVTTGTVIQFVVGNNFNMGTITSPNIPLKAGMTYKLRGFTQIVASAAAGARFAFVNASGGAEISELRHGISYTTTFGGNAGSQPVAGGFYTPTADITLNFKCVSHTGSPELQFESFGVEVEQLK